MEPDDLLLPDPSEQTDEVVPRQALPAWEWPFSTRDTILLGLLYLAPFAIKWLTTP